MKSRYENPAAAEWYHDIILQPEKFPFSFAYGEDEYQGFRHEKLTLTKRERKTEPGRETNDLFFILDGQVDVVLRSAFYPAYGVAEWTVWFENNSPHDSGVLHSLRSTLTFPGRNPVLRGILGDHDNLYRPYCQELGDVSVTYCSDSGRPTHVNFPYFNLEFGDQGVMLAIGWAGTWTAEFSFDGEKTTYAAQSTNNIRTYLKPGEKIRTALFVRAAYTVRNEHFAGNYWRRWFIEHNMPPMDAAGGRIKPFSTCCIANDTGLPNSDGSISERHYTWKPSLEKMLAEDARVDFRWFDAGWYVAPDGSSPEWDWWGSVGTWELDPAKWPGQTFRESTDFARKHGMKTLMWFEPERITDPDNLVKHYGYKKEWAIVREGYPNIANNIGDPECLAWTTARVCKVLRENRVELYREDNNSDPADLWAYLDRLETGARTGITECKFVIGHYRLWDDIIDCTLGHGGCGFVDSCASGGGRNDLESLRRAVPLLRSDYDRTSTSLRLSMTTTFNRWIPFCGANTKEKEGQLSPTGKSDPYVWRASYLPILNVDSQFTQDPDQDFDMLRFGLREWKKVSPWLLKDFYVHTPWHSEHDRSNFTAYSFYDEEQGRGVLFLFRMENCPLDFINVKFPYAKADRNYTLRDEDTKEESIIDGRKASSEGVRFLLAEKRMARLIWVTETM